MEIARGAALVALCIVAAAASAAAHGGELHPWPGTPSGSNYIRTKIASCNKWVAGSGTVKYSLADSTAPPKAAAKPVSIKGDATIWAYLYKNCSLEEGAPPSGSLEVNLAVMRDGKPVSNMTLDGLAMTGTCASGSGKPFYFNTSADPIDGNENLLWFHEHELPKNGTARGNGANDGAILTSGANAVRSVSIVNAETREVLGCCDLILAGPATTDWSASLEGKGQNCTEDGHGDDSNHSGGDHSEHDGHDHSSHGNTTAAAPAAAAKSGAGSVAGSAAAAVLAAAAAVLLA